MKDHILFTGFEDGGVIFDLDTRVSCEINSTGVELLRLMDGQRELGEIIRMTAQIFEQPEERIEKDITRFLANLLERGWIYVQ
ncbi:MAG: PqqD family protein [Deltaproteobacteria bacterium]|nr:PqqD family protein [Deltaproteobacteria bacterium]